MLQEIHNFLLSKKITTRSWSILFGVALALICCLLLLVNFFDPTDIGPNGLLLFFALLYGFCFVCAILLFKLYRLVFRRPIGSIKLLYLASVIAFAPVMLLALNTLNQLEPLDIGLMILFEALALFYIARRMK